MNQDVHRKPRGKEIAELTEAKLPHDRDESAEPVHEDAQHKENRKPIEQARLDVEAGLVDTERIGTPNDVPTRRTRKPART